MHVQFGDYHVSRPGVRRRVRRRRQEGRLRPGRGHLRQREQHHQDRRRAADRRHRAARPHPRRPRQVLPGDDQRVAGRAGRRRRRAARGPRRRPRLLPAGRLRGRREVLRPVRHRRRRAPSSTRCRCSSPAPRSGPRSSAPPACRSSATTSSSQVGATITHRVLAKLFEDRGVVLDRTMQLNVGGNMDFMNMLERDRLESKKISKTQAVTSQVDRTISASATCTSARPTTCLAGRPQVGLRPARGPRLRRRPAEPGVQARGLGLAELGRRHHRRGPRGEDRPGPRHRRPDPVRVLVLHEVPAGAVPATIRPATRWRRSSPARSERLTPADRLSFRGQARPHRLDRSQARSQPRPQPGSITIDHDNPCREHRRVVGVSCRDRHDQREGRGEAPAGTRARDQGPWGQRPRPGRMGL